VADNFAKSSNHDLDELRSISMGPDSTYGRRKLAPQKQGTDISSVKRGTVGAGGDFYGPAQVSQDQSHSVLSNDFAFLNDDAGAKGGIRG